MIKKILIIGSSGFLGINFLDKIKNYKKFEVHALVHKKKYINKNYKNIKFIQANICKYKDLEKKLKSSYDCILNFSGNIDHKKNKETYDVHYTGVKNLVKIIKKKNSKLLIQLGSSLEYGIKKPPHNEKTICKPISYYGKAKHLATKFIRKKLKNYLILRPYQIYGPHQKIDRLIPIAIVSFLKNKTFPCSEGIQLRDFLFVDDFNKLLIKILNKKKIKNGIYNVGSGKPLKVRYVIETIFKLIGRGQAKFGKIKMRKDEINAYYTKIDKVKKDFNWQPNTNILNGVSKTIKFYKNKKTKK